MMNSKIKMIHAISFMFLLLLSCEKKNNIPDCELPEENAKLKRVLEYASIEAMEATRVLEQYEYDLSGRISKFSLPMEVDSNINNHVFYYEIYTYNPQGRLAQKARYNANIYAPGGYQNQMNTTYTYASDGKLTREDMEYPLINAHAYSLYSYSHKVLKKVEKYKMNSNEPESYTEYIYDECGRLIRENKVYMADLSFINYTQHSYQNGLNIQSDDYAGRDATNIEHIREKIKSYDAEYNLITIEIKELQEYSSQPSRVWRYEYYEE